MEAERHPTDVARPQNKKVPTSLSSNSKRARIDLTDHKIALYSLSNPHIRAKTNLTNQTILSSVSSSQLGVNDFFSERQAVTVCPLCHVDSLLKRSRFLYSRVCCPCDVDVDFFSGNTEQSQENLNCFSTGLGTRKTNVCHFFTRPSLTQCYRESLHASKSGQCFTLSLFDRNNNSGQRNFCMKHRSFYMNDIAFALSETETSRNAQSRRSYVVKSKIKCVVIGESRSYHTKREGSKIEEIIARKRAKLGEIGHTIMPPPAKIHSLEELKKSWETCHSRKLAEDPKEQPQRLKPSQLYRVPRVSLSSNNSNDAELPMDWSNSGGGQATSQGHGRFRGQGQYSGHVVRVEGDGRCLFRSLVVGLSHCLQGCERDDFGRPLRLLVAEEETLYADLLREQVVLLMRDNIHFYSELEKSIINADQPVNREHQQYSKFKDRLEAMSRPHTMPGDLELNAVAMVLERRILVLDTELKSIMVYGQERYPQAPYLAVRYTRLVADVGHYDAVLLDETSQRILYNMEGCSSVDGDFECKNPTCLSLGDKPCTNVLSRVVKRTTSHNSLYFAPAFSEIQKPRNVQQAEAGTSKTTAAHPGEETLAFQNSGTRKSKDIDCCATALNLSSACQSRSRSVVSSKQSRLNCHGCGKCHQDSTKVSFTVSSNKPATLNHCGRNRMSRNAYHDDGAVNGKCSCGTACALSQTRRARKDRSLSSVRRESGSTNSKRGRTPGDINNSGSPVNKKRCYHKKSSLCRNISSNSHRTAESQGRWCVRYERSKNGRIGKHGCIKRYRVFRLLESRPRARTNGPRNVQRKTVRRQRNGCVPKTSLKSQNARTNCAKMKSPKNLCKRSQNPTPKQFCESVDNLAARFPLEVKVICCRCMLCGHHVISSCHAWLKCLICGQVAHRQCITMGENFRPQDDVCEDTFFVCRDCLGT